MQHCSLAQHNDAQQATSGGGNHWRKLAAEADGEWLWHWVAKAETAKLTAAFGLRSSARNGFFWYIEAIGNARTAAKETAVEAIADTAVAATARASKRRKRQLWKFWQLWQLWQLWHFTARAGKWAARQKLTKT